MRCAAVPYPEWGRPLSAEKIFLRWDSIFRLKSVNDYTDATQTKRSSPLVNWDHRIFCRKASSAAATTALATLPALQQLLRLLLFFWPSGFSILFFVIAIIRESMLIGQLATGAKNSL